MWDVGDSPQLGGARFRSRIRLNADCGGGPTQCQGRRASPPYHLLVAALAWDAPSHES